jgi:CHAT domain-containing protein
MGMDFAEALKRAQLYLRRLTHREALDILAHSLAPVGEILTPTVPPNEDPPNLPKTERVWQQAGAYLKGLVKQEKPDDPVILPGEADEELIFATPFYWAPFILII